MDPVTGLGLAASVIQIVTFGIQTVEACGQMYQQGSISEYSSLDDRTGYLANLTMSLQQSLQPSSGAQSRALAKEEEDLVVLARKCQGCAEKLQKELRKLQTQPHASALHAIRKTARAIWKRKTIEKLHQELLAYRSTLETSLLSRLSQRFDVQGILIDKSFANLDTNLKHLVTCLANSQTSLAKLVVQESEKTRDRIDRLQKFQIDERRYREIVDILSYPDISARQVQIDHQFDGIENSYDWIFDEPQTRPSLSSDRTTPQEQGPLWDDFARWLKSGHGVYWINGKAGSGKSTLMNYICTHKRRVELLKEWCSTRRLLTPMFFFWNSGSLLQKSIDGLLRSLIHQMIEECRELIGCLINDSLRTWGTRRLTDILFNLLAQSQTPLAVCIFIDGLDEFEGSSDIVLEMITKLANQTNVKVCVSSRPLLAYEEAFSRKPSLKLQDLTLESIQKYAELKLSNPIRERFSLDSNNGHEAEGLLDKIVRRADGVFIWAVIAIRDVREGLREMADMNELAEMIESLPGELDDLFMGMLKRIKPAYQRDATKFLQIVLYSRLLDFELYSPPFEMDLCTLHFSHSQRELRDTPFIYYEVSTRELVAACRTLKTRLLSHTAGLLELTPSNKGHQLYGTRQDLDPVLFVKINFLHKTVRDFLLNNAAAKSRLDLIGLTEAQVRLCIARGILAQVAHFSQEYVGTLDVWPNPVYPAFLASLQHISQTERLLGSSQAKLMRSLDFATFARAYHVSDKPDWFPIEAFLIENSGETMDLVGMAAAVGMTLYVCEQLDLPIETRRYLPSLLDPDIYSRNRATPATICWTEGNQLRESEIVLATGLGSSNYRQILDRCLQWTMDNPLSLLTASSIEIVPLAETYMLSCCRPMCLDLARILLRAGANPMVRVRSILAHPFLCFPDTTESFWNRWLQLLLALRRRYMRANRKSGGILLETDQFDKVITFNDVFDTTKSILVHGADINYQLETHCYLKRPDLDGERIRLELNCSALFILEECFNSEPEFREFMVGVEPLITIPTREIVWIAYQPSGEDFIREDLQIYPTTEEIKALWPLIEKWESTGSRGDRNSLQAAMEAVVRAHCSDEDLKGWGLEPRADHETDDDSGLDSSAGDEDDEVGLDSDLDTEDDTNSPHHALKAARSLRSPGLPGAPA